MSGAADRNRGRNSSFELLRIVAVLMVISVHYLDAGGGGILSRPFFFSFNNSIARVLESLAIAGVNLFVLIAGYFGVKQKGINLRRLSGIVLLVSFWGVLLFFHGIASGNEFSLMELVKSMFPYMFGTLWYIRVYIILFLLTPFLNLLLDSLNKRGYTALVLIFFVLFSVLSSFVPAFKNGSGYDIIHFVMMYCIGGYIRIGINKLPSKIICLLTYLISSAIVTVFSLYGDDLLYWGYDFVFVVISSVSLFMFFANIDFNSKIVNYIAKTVLGIYILNVSFPYLYTKFVIREAFFDSKYFILHFLCSVFSFFVVAFLLESARIMLFSVTVDKVLDKIKFINKRYLVNIGKNTEQGK